MSDLAQWMRNNRRYHVKLLDGTLKRVDNKNDAIERVQAGSALEWWWEEHFGSREIERLTQEILDIAQDRPVNLAGKSGGLWEKTKIVAYRDLKLHLEGGFFIRNTFTQEVERLPVGDRHNWIYPFDIARGFVWGFE